MFGITKKPADWPERRRRMVEEQIVRRGITNERVIAAMTDVPREAFVPPEARDSACDDSALPIGQGQTISQPYMVAFMTDRLDVQPNHTVLEIGTGSGYQAAVLAKLCRRVISIERVDALGSAAAAILADVGITNVTIHCADGTLGWPAEAPYDRILVTAGGPDVPQALRDQLAEGGVLIAPIGAEREQVVVRLDKADGQVTETSLIRCRFVKLLGAQGWHAAEDS